jgi:hypothetical protein
MTFFLPTGARLRARLSIVETKTVRLPSKTDELLTLVCSVFKVGYETSVSNRVHSTTTK